MLIDMDLTLITRIYLLVINIAGFAVMGVDKSRAIRGAWRIPEKTLFAVAVFGGAIGGWIGMYFFRHKTRHWYFVVGFPAIIAIELFFAYGWSQILA